MDCEGNGTPCNPDKLLKMFLDMIGVWGALAIGGVALPVASTAFLVLATDCKHAGKPHTV